MSPIRVDAVDAMRGSFSIAVKLKRVRQARFRLWVASLLIRLAGTIVSNNVNITVES